MGCWIIGDNQDFIDKVSLALQRLNLRCQETHRVSLADAARSSHFLESADGVAFIALPTVSDDDVALIRRIRSLSRVHLVLVSSLEDNTSVVNALRAGVSDYLDIEHDLATEISACLSRIKRAEA